MTIKKNIYKNTFTIEFTVLYKFHWNKINFEEKAPSYDTEREIVEWMKKKTVQKEK